MSVRLAFCSMPCHRHAHSLRHNIGGRRWAAANHSANVLRKRVPSSSLVVSYSILRRTTLEIAKSSPWKSCHRHTVVAAAAARSYSSSAAVASNSDGDGDDNTYPPHTLYPMPALSPTMESGSIAVWKLNEGDAFGAGDSLCTIETDKASVDFEAQDDGFLAKIIVVPGVDVPIGTPICVVTEQATDVPYFASFQVAAAASATSAATAASASTQPMEPLPSAATAVTHHTTGSSSILLPSARHLAESRGKDATVLVGSAKGGRVTKGDVLAALQAGSLPNLTTQTTTSAAVVVAASSTTAAATTTTTAKTAPSTVSAPVVGDPLASAVGGLVHSNNVTPEAITGQSSFADVPNNKMRKIIASRLTDSKRNVPHFYVTMDIDIDAILALRKQWQNQHSVKVSVNDFIIRSCALALRDVPTVNGITNQSIDVSVAVATPTGLITPIVFQTDKLGLAEISRTVADLAGRARQGKLQPHEYQGGTFSISNLGMFGVTSFAAVINPPQAAILAVGGGVPTWMPGDQSISDLDDMDPSSHGRKTPPVEKTIMTAQLSADRSVVDEATASQFLQALRHYMQTPELLML